MEEHVNYLYVICMTGCIVLVCTKFLLTTLLYHIQHVYCVSSVPYMQVAVIEIICSYTLKHYAAKAFTA